MTKEELKEKIKTLRKAVSAAEAEYYRLYVCKSCSGTGYLYPNPLGIAEVKSFWYCSCEEGKIARDRQLEPGSV